jgi:Tetratricopeptide repeat
VPPCLPFLVLAPSDFVHDVLTAQLGRKTNALGGATGFGDRLLLLSGLGGWRGITDWSLPALVLFAALAVLVLVTYGLAFAERSLLEWFVLVAAVVVNVGMFASAELYDHYAYFPAVFLAILLGVSTQGTIAFVSGRRRQWPAHIPSVASVGGIVAATVIVGAGIAHNTAYARAYLGDVSDPSVALRAAVPKGACVLSDFPVDLLIADRLIASRPGCPVIVDPFGLFLTDDGGNQPHPAPPYRQAFLDKWRGWLDHADYVVLRIEFSDFLPWSQEQIDWFNQHYELVDHDHVEYEHPFIDTRKDMYVYRNRDRTATRAAAPSSSALIDRGLAALTAGRLDEAKQDYEAALTVDPQNKIAAYDLGVLAQQRGQVDEAKQWYLRVLNIDPSYSSALYNLAILVKPNSPGLAEDLYRRLLITRPDDANVHLQLGLLLQQEGRTSEGQAEVDAARRLDPNIAVDAQS